MKVLLVLLGLCAALASAGVSHRVRHHEHKHQSPKHHPLHFWKSANDKNDDARQCDGLICPTGCCEDGNESWFCCTDGYYCAITSSDCPDWTNPSTASPQEDALPNDVARVVLPPPETFQNPCPNNMTNCMQDHDGVACCPVSHFICCEVNMNYCAVSEEACQAVSTTPRPVKFVPLFEAMFDGGEKGPLCGEGVQDCPTGCCPNLGWHCCEDGRHCASTPADCP